MKIKKINEFLEKMDHISKNANIVKTKDCISYTFENVMITVYECNRIAFHINNFYACFETENLISMFILKMVLLYSLNQFIQLW